MYDCTGSMRLGFGVEEGNGGDVCSSGRSCYKLPPCPVEPMPADSKMEPPLAKWWGGMSDCGSTSGMAHLRRGVFNWFKRRVRCVKEARERKCFRHQSREPPQPMAVHVKQILTCNTWRTLHWKSWMPKDSFDPLGSPCWSSLFLKDCVPWEGPHPRARVGNPPLGRKEQQRQHAMNWPQPPFLVPVEEDEKNFRVVKPRKKGETEAKDF